MCSERRGRMEGGALEGHSPDARPEWKLSARRSLGEISDSGG